MQELLQGLVNSGQIKARTKWKEVYPAFAEDTRYLNILGNPGSNPLELFWDIVDDLDQKLDAKIGTVEDAIKRYNKQFEQADGDVPMGEGQEPKESPKAFKIVPDTTMDEILAIITKDEEEAARQLSSEDLEEIFRTVCSPYRMYVPEANESMQLHEQAVKQQADEKRRAERRQRHLQDDLRYALKKLPDPLDVNLPYEEVNRPHCFLDRR